ncbi:hypothetical protein [Paenibacillus swuensis]|uniref:hypothetical protein n=1 Tax=Paenibacillus swuensis TaxID=1178515 RepID=UPI0009ED0E8B|nr:hypothetical protein [Paenibacillus swuensis]
MERKAGKTGLRKSMRNLVDTLVDVDKVEKKDGEFADAYTFYVERQIRESKGARLIRLQEVGIGHAESLFLEKVWWPIFGHFEYLHAEYEVRDFEDGYRFIDFAYIRGRYKIGFEVDPYGTHARDISRWDYDNQLERGNHLLIDDWLITRYSLNHVTNKSRRCQQFVLHLFGHWFGAFSDDDTEELNMREREIVKLFKGTN